LTRYRVAVFGVDHPHSKGWAETLRNTPGVEVAAFYDRSEGSRGLLEEAYASKNFYTDAEELVENEDFSLAAVLLPNNEAPSVVKMLAEAGKHILLEKPGARSAEELRPAVEAVKLSRVKLSVGYVRRFHPLAREVKVMVERGLLGRVFSAEGRIGASTVRLRNPRHFLFSRGVSGGGILSWLGVHWFDLLRFMLGSEVESVSAIVGNVGGEEIDVEDAASVALRFENGAIGSVHAGYFLPDGYDMFLGLRGRLGWASWDPGSDDLTVKSLAPGWSGGLKRVRYTPPQVPGYGGQMGLDMVADLLSAIEQDRSPLVNEDDALRVLRIVDAAYESSRTGKLQNIFY